MYSNRNGFPASFRPLAAIEGMSFMLMGVLQLAYNQFGLDRDGFRVFVLCAAPRRDILLGKNLSYFPIALGMCAVLVTAVQVACPMRIDHVLAMIPLSLSMLLSLCACTNLISIYTPVHLAAGSTKPSSMKATTMLVQFLMFFVLILVTQAVALSPFGAEALLRLLGRAEGVPVFLLLSLAECALVVVLYRYVIEWQGGLFQAREQKILETVTNRGA
jgi:ABC-2 type transport system permease protein